MINRVGWIHSFNEITASSSGRFSNLQRVAAGIGRDLVFLQVERTPGSM